MSYYNILLKDTKAFQFIEKSLGYPLEALVPFPKFLMIETINACNARCIMCGIDFDKKKKIVMSDSLFDKIISEIGEHSGHVEKVMLYFNDEPLLNKDLPLKIQKVKKSGIKIVNIASNASLLDREKAREVIEAGLDEIYIAMDSLKEDVYQTIRRGLKFETVYKNIINFIQLRNQLNSNLNIRIQMILQELNRHEADSFTRHWKPLLRADDQVVVRKVHKWATMLDTMKFDDENKINNVPCFILWSTLCIDVNGKAALCCMDTNNTSSLGNVASETIAEIWTGALLKRIREMHISGRRGEIALCNRCNAWSESKYYRKEVMKCD